MIINPLGFTSINGSETIRIDYAAIATSMTCQNISVNKFYALNGTQKSTHNIVDTTTSTYALVETFTDSSATGVSLLANSVSRPLSLGSNNTIQLTMKQPTTSGTPATGQVIIASPVTMSGLPITNMVMNTTPATTDVTNCSYVNQQISNALSQSGGAGVPTSYFGSATIAIQGNTIPYGQTTLLQWLISSSSSGLPVTVMTGTGWRHTFSGYLDFGITGQSVGLLATQLNIMDANGNIILYYALTTTTMDTGQVLFFKLQNVLLPSNIVQPISLRVYYTGIQSSFSLSLFGFVDWAQQATQWPNSASNITVGNSQQIGGVDYAVPGDFQYLNAY